MCRVASYAYLNDQNSTLRKITHMRVCVPMSNPPTIMHIHQEGGPGSADPSASLPPPSPILGAPRHTQSNATGIRDAWFCVRWHLSVHQLLGLVPSQRKRPSVLGLVGHMER